MGGKRKSTASVYLEWDAFMAAAKKIYLGDPFKTRYTVKYRHHESKLVLKVTDDVVVIKYKTDQAADVKKVEKLNNEFFKLMSLKRLDPASLAAQEDEPAVKEPEATAASKKKKTSKRS